MGLITRMRKQKAVYWSLLNDGRPNEFGDPEYDSPVEIDCRWEDVSELFLDEMGKEQVTNAIVYVDRVVLLHSLLRKGPIADLVSNSPFSNTGVYAIRKFEELPNLRNTETLLTAKL